RRPRLADPREREVLARYLGAWERTDPRALAALLKEDVRLSMPPSPAWCFGRDAVARFFAAYPWSPSARRHLHVATRANRQPALRRSRSRSRCCESRTV